MEVRLHKAVGLLLSGGGIVNKLGSVGAEGSGNLLSVFLVVVHELGHR